MNKFEKFLMFFNIENDPKIVQDLYAQSEMTKTYTALLLLANFIALFGLITDSSAVIIGAMLISPLMGPIISFGFAYITSEKQLIRLSLTTLAKSLLYVIASAALLSYISPLNDITEQILARTKPNLYDLFIAIFSGLVVAVSFLSKKVNSITILTGVAIATSIIPPLSVVGFGIGTGNWNISVGSFLLFFTNFTAIVATTALSGILFGYTYFQNLKNFNYIRKRLIMILLIIAGVSLPLSYTLKQSVENIKIRRVVNQSVAQIKNVTVFNMNYEMDEKHKNLNLNIALASGRSISKEDIIKLKTEIETRLDVKSNITVTQVALKEDLTNNRQTVVAGRNVVPLPETVSSAALKLREKTDEMSLRLARLLSPYPITGYSLSVNSDKTAKISIYIKKDSDFSDEEKAIISNFIKSEYKFDAEADVITSGLFEPIEFPSSADEPAVIPQNLDLIKEILEKDTKAAVFITGRQDLSLKNAERTKKAAQNADYIKNLLMEKYGISAEKIFVSVAEKPADKPCVEIKIRQQD